MIFDADLISRACAANPWFTSRFVQERLQIVSNQWERLPLPGCPTRLSRIGIVAAGNIPLVCAHDLFCVYLCSALAPQPVELEVKLSSKDAVLLPELWPQMQASRPPVPLTVRFVSTLFHPQALLFSGGSTAEAHYRAAYPQARLLVRSSRTSVAVLDGSEDGAKMEGLAYDCFSYFGLGCRNVTMLLVPEGYDFAPFLQAVERLSSAGGPLDELRAHKGFGNAYRHARAVALMEGDAVVDGGVFLLKASANMFPDMAVLHYVTYRDRDQVMSFLRDNAPQIQCVPGVGVPFGQAQFPGFYDFADGINTLEWLQNF